REVHDQLVEALLDRGEARLQAIFEQRKIVRLAAPLIPALERRGRQIELRQDVTEAGRQHLLALQAAAQAEQRQVDRERERRRVTAELAVEPLRRAGVGRRREQAAGPR